MRAVLFGCLAVLATLALFPLTGCIDSAGSPATMTEAIVYMSEAPFTITQTKAEYPWVWLMTATGAQTAYLDDEEASSIAQGSLSPDGTAVVYCDPGYAIYRYDLATGNVTTLYTGDDPYTPAWSPDGDTIIFTDGESGDFGSICTIDSTTGNNFNELLAAETGEYYGNPRYNRAGTKIVFHDENEQIAIMDADGTNVEVLTAGGDNLHPAFLPDGRILYTHSAGDGAQFDLWIIDADGDNARALTNTPGADEFYPTSNYAGTRIAFGVGNQNNGDVYVATFNGTSLGTPTNLTASNSNPCWRPEFGRISTALLDTVFSQND